jgi:putative transposase
MLQLQAFKYELMPSGAQQRDMSRFAGACRFVFNKALALQQANHAAGKKYIRYVEMANLLPAWKRELPWLKEAPSQALQHALKNLDRAFTNFFDKRAEFPRFKKRGYDDSFRFPQGLRFDQDNSRIFLPKLGWMRYRNSRHVQGELRNVTVSSCSGKWFLSIQTAREGEKPVHPSSSAVGIDMGIVRFATLSNGEVIEPRNCFKQHQARLRKAQQAMSRKKKFSNNWKRARARVQKIHLQIRNARHDFLHKASTAISKNHAIVAIEDLRVNNMSRSAAGTAEAPGRKVRAKAGLNRTILDQGWAEFGRQLEYKMAWSGGQLVAVPPINTSRTCPQCGHIAAQNRTSQAQFRCMECGFEDHADLVGAINIRRAGLARIACEVNGEVSPQQQEPTEAAA